MNIRKFIFCLMAASALTVSAQQINPMTQAVLESYRSILDENPKDYTTLYQRGAQYVSLGMYDKALADVENAIKYTPEKDKDMRYHEYALLSTIYSAQKKFDLALEATDKALVLNPDSYPMLYEKGNLCLELKDTKTATACFRRMQGIKSRSQEAMFGLARIAVAEGRSSDAKDLLKEAENLDPSSSNTYISLGRIHREMGDNDLAAADYLNAFALASNPQRAIEGLADLARTDYPAVENALNYGLSKTTNTLPLNFLKANIALMSGNYAQAYNAFKELMEKPEGKTSLIYTSFARTCIALDKPEEALTAARNAVSDNGSAEAYLVKAQAERIAGNFATALIDAEKAYQQDINSTAALKEMALANIGQDKYEAALANLNEAVLTDPSDMEAILIRAYIYSDKLKDNKSALGDYKRIINSPTSDFESIVRKALATTLSGNKKAGDALIEENLTSASAPEDFFNAAIYYSQAGELAKGKEMLDKARNLGYQNEYKINTDKTANLNIAPIRHL